VEGEMPTGLELLTKCLATLDESESWRADVTLQAALPDRSGEETYVGKLWVDKSPLRASLRTCADRDVEWHLVVSDKKVVAWRQLDADTTQAEGKAQGNRDRLERVARIIELLEVMGRLPGYPWQLAETSKTHRFTNKGVAGADAHAAYVVEAAPNHDGKTAPSQASPIDGRVLIGISLANYLPTHLISRSTGGGWRMIRFDSIDLKSTGEDPSAARQPPEGAIAIDLKSDVRPTTRHKNPVPFGPESVARGKRLYLADCVVCHSTDGTGRDSDVTDNASDLTDTTYWKSDGSDGASFLAIRDGAGDEMPPYKDKYRDEKSIWDLVNYIRSLQRKK